MNSSWIFGVLLGVILLVFSTAYAESTPCISDSKDGKCASAPGSFSRLETTQSSSDSLIHTKQQMYEDFDSIRFSLTRKHGIDYPTTAVERLCLNEETSLKECKEAISDARTDLYEQVKLVQQENLQQKAGASETKHQSDNVQVVIQENNNLYVPPRRPPGHWHRPTPRPEKPHDGEKMDGITRSFPDKRVGVPQLNKQDR